MTVEVIKATLVDRSASTLRLVDATARNEIHARNAATNREVVSRLQVQLRTSSGV
jgi:hypothetical protein